jgi:hypothetical protein
MNEYHFYCSICGKEKTYVTGDSLDSVKSICETHEKEIHNGKQVGTYGWHSPTTLKD